MVGDPSNNHWRTNIFGPRAARSREVTYGPSKRDRDVHPWRVTTSEHVRDLSKDRAPLRGTLPEDRTIRRHFAHPATSSCSKESVLHIMGGSGKVPVFLGEWGGARMGCGTHDVS